MPAATITTGSTTPWPPWALDEPFFIALTQWKTLHPGENTFLEAVLKKDPSALPVPARGLATTLAHLSELGMTSPNLKDNIDTFTRDVLRWVEKVQVVFDKNSKFAWQTLYDVRNLIEEMCLWAREQEGEAPEFQTRLEEAGKLFQDLSILGLDRSPSPTSRRGLGFAKRFSRSIKDLKQNVAVEEELRKIRETRAQKAKPDTEMPVLVSPSTSTSLDSRSTKSSSSRLKASIPTLSLSVPFMTISPSQSPILQTRADDTQARLLAMIQATHEAKMWKKKKHRRPFETKVAALCALDALPSTRRMWVAHLQTQIERRGGEYVDRVLDGLTGLGADNVEGLYAAVLRGLFGRRKTRESEAEVELFRSVVGAVMYAREQLGMDELRELLGGGEGFRDTVERWGAIVLDGGAVEDSFRKYVTSERMDARFRIEAGEAHLELGGRCLAWIGREKEKMPGYAQRHYKTHLELSGQDVRGVVIINHQAGSLPPSELAGLLLLQAEKRVAEMDELKDAFAGMGSPGWWTVIKTQRQAGYVDGMRWYAPNGQKSGVMWVFAERGIVRVSEEGVLLQM